MAKKSSLLIPGEVLKGKLDEYNLHITQVAEDIGLSVSAIRQIISNKAKISLHIAKRLAKYFATDTEYWVKLQNDYDLAELDKDPQFNDELKAIPKAKKLAAPVVSGRGRKPANAAAAADAKAPVGRKPKKDVSAATVQKVRKPRAKKVTPDMDSSAGE